ncbi:carbon-nitrogen hydrolase [Phycisphaera mikurensis]|uniref:Putative hydrolase n=1 Tax=Phycisphaera mikurensis (strain NBRC 102666 / KCTC 22515 / FYK2301M01) TaxID=1142394 RepID=I0IAN2_PHYMF|nr:carbon-nitrogen hydrolase [Phycisphaera mikurensis]MBB6441684.1 N-carbamoylputrescine amidase [Phycisphaera mikurensis]BAM02320.1 putative hydrolase [Phycisphaera mikurensis NBRC 102666]
MAEARTLTVGLLQHACPVGEPAEETFARTKRLAREAAGRGAELLVTQELFKGPYFCQVEDERGFEHAEAVPAGETCSRLAALAEELGVHVSGSLFERRAPGLCHNTAVLFDPRGELAGRYRKMHVPEDPRFYEKFYFTPGEAEPAADRWPHAGSGPMIRDGFQSWVLRAEPAEIKLGPLVCWDQWFPEAARLTAMQGAEVLLYPTAIGAWHGEDAGVPETQAAAWHTIQRSHAIANGVFVAACNRVGVEGELTFWGGSFVVDPAGTVIAEASKDQEEALVVGLDLTRIEKQRRGWPFLRDRRVDAYGGLLRRWGTP